MNPERHNQLGVELLIKGVTKYSTELSSVFSKTQSLVYKYMGLGKHSWDAKIYCKFLFNSLDTAYRAEISFTLTPQFYQ